MMLIHQTLSGINTSVRPLLPTARSPSHVRRDVQLCVTCKWANILQSRLFSISHSSFSSFRSCYFLLSLSLSLSSLFYMQMSCVLMVQRCCCVCLIYLLLILFFAEIILFCFCFFLSREEPVFASLSSSAKHPASQWFHFSFYHYHLNAPIKLTLFVVLCML